MIRKITCRLALTAGALFVSQAAFGVVIHSQDFNALSDAGIENTDTLPTGSNLTNTGSFNSGGPGLDFSTRWDDTRGNGTGPVTATGDTSDFIGVNSFSGANAPDVSPNGTPVASGSEHNFEFNDGDGLLTLSFEVVDLSGYTNRQLSFSRWINDTGYESDDFFHFTMFDGAGGSTTFSTSDTQLENGSSLDNGTANWSTFTADLDSLFAISGLSGANFSFTFSVDNNSSVENIFIDDVLITGDVVNVPEPTTLALMGLGLAGIGYSRRQKA